MSEIKIERGIPIPNKINGRPERKYPAPLLEIGESFFAPIVGTVKSTAALAGAYNKFLKPKRFVSRAVKENGAIIGYRVWRTK